MLNRKGFTLIELLIVIVIIGLLAAVVLAAINPIEARNRAQDTANLADAAQVVNSIDRFYAAKGYYPWMTGPTDTTTAMPSNAVLDQAWFTTMETAGEIKPEFKSRASITGGTLKIYAYTVGGQNLVRVCFPAQSTEYKTSKAKFAADGLAAGNVLVCAPE